jgi:hypothetical protein
VAGHFPYFDSLAEALVKAEGKGAIAAISPSGMSFDAPAHGSRGSFSMRFSTGATGGWEMRSSPLKRATPLPAPGRSY